jgi:hypothetical protein
MSVRLGISLFLIYDSRFASENQSRTRRKISVYRAAASVTIASQSRWEGARKNKGLVTPAMGMGKFLRADVYLRRRERLNGWCDSKTFDFIGRKIVVNN